MKFTSTLIKGKLIKRYKRFFADIKVNNSTVTAHCPNTGSMLGLLDKNNEAWISKADDPNRKLKFTLEIINSKKLLIGVNTHRANRIVEHALRNRLIQEFKSVKNIKPEFKFSKDTRFDFLCDNKILEVKNVTFTREKSLAEFPDAVTSRGQKHIKQLLNARKKGYEIYILFVIQRNDCNEFQLARDLDPDYYELLTKAVKRKLNVLCYDCKFSPKGIKLNNKIKLKI